MPVYNSMFRAKRGHGYECGSGGMVDTLVLEASAERHESSSLFFRTKKFGWFLQPPWFP